MIFRRPRPIDPRLLLAPALALALPLGADLSAFAQAPLPHAQTQTTIPAAVTPPADALRQHDQELEAARAQQRESSDSQVRLRLEIEALGQDRRALNQQLIASATRVRDVETKIDAVQGRLQTLDHQQSVFQKSLDERRNVIIEILAALQRVGRQPPPALLVRPEDALQALRTAITLGAVVPHMREEAEAIAGDIADLSRVRSDIVIKHRELSQNLGQLAREQLRLNLLIDERQKKQASAEQSLQAEQQRATDLAQRVGNLQELIAKLEQDMDKADRQSRTDARAIEQDASGPGLAALADPGRLAPAVTFAAMRGQMHLPVNGDPIHGFGDTDGAGGTRKGLSIASKTGAEVTSPCDGWVVYAGPFRSYGQLLILNAGGGYHVLLAGMQRISVDLGQFVLTGEPVATMGDGAQAAAAVAAGFKKPVLYVEFRKDGAPFDPSPWWATNESEKVRG